MESKYDYVVFDIETTGLHPDSDQICEIAAIGVKDGLPQGTFSTLVAIEGSMPEAAGRVNGITDDMLKGAPAIGDALDAFLDFIGDDAVLAGHNITSFDIPFVANAAAKSGRVFIYPYVIDTLEAARELWPANQDGGKARREAGGVTVTRRAMLQRWRLVRMGDG